MFYIILHNCRYNYIWWSVSGYLSGHVSCLLDNRVGKCHCVYIWLQVNFFLFINKPTFLWGTGRLHQDTHMLHSMLLWKDHHLHVWCLRFLSSKWIYTVWLSDLVVSSSSSWCKLYVGTMINDMTEYQIKGRVGS